MKMYRFDQALDKSIEYLTKVAGVLVNAPELTSDTGLVLVKQLVESLKEIQERRNLLIESSYEEIAALKDVIEKWENVHELFKENLGTEIVISNPKGKPLTSPKTESNFSLEFDDTSCSLCNYIKGNCSDCLICGIYGLKCWENGTPWKLFVDYISANNKINLGVIYNIRSIIMWLNKTGSYLIPKVEKTEKTEKAKRFKGTLAEERNSVERSIHFLSELLLFYKDSRIALLIIPTLKMLMEIRNPLGKRIPITNKEMSGILHEYMYWKNISDILYLSIGKSFKIDNSGTLEIGETKLDISTPTQSLCKAYGENCNNCIISKITGSICTCMVIFNTFLNGVNEKELITRDMAFSIKCYSLRFLDTASMCISKG